MKITLNKNSWKILGTLNAKMIVSFDRDIGVTWIRFDYLDHNGDKFTYNVGSSYYILDNNVEKLYKRFLEDKNSVGSLTSEEMLDLVDLRNKYPNLEYSYVDEPNDWEYGHNSPNPMSEGL